LARHSNSKYLSIVPWDQLYFADLVQTDAEFNAEDADAYASLVQLVASGQAVAVVGAGISVSAGFPTWPDLLSQLAAELREWDGSFSDPVPESNKWLEYADKVRLGLEAFGKEVFANLMGRIFHRSRSLVGTQQYDHLKPLHLSIVRLPFAGLTTTNFDSVLEHAIEAAFSGGTTPSQTPKTVCIHGGNTPDLSRAIRSLAIRRDTVLMTAPESVIHWHGTYGSAPTIVLGAQQFEDAYGLTGLVLPHRGPGVRRPSLQPRMTRLLAALSAVLITQRVVFLGFSLDDPYFASVLGQVAETLWDWGQSVHFAVLPLYVGDREDEKRQRDTARKRFARLGIRPVWYPVVQGDFGALQDLVEMLASDIVVGHRTKASEDRAVSAVETAISSAPVAPAPAASTPQMAKPKPRWVDRAVAEFEQKGGRDED
jgi:hypothetical protein